MKKMFFVAAAALLMVGFNSCKEGSCACVGTTDGIQTDIEEYSAQSGMSNSAVCSEIKGHYPNALGIECAEGKTVDELKEEIRKR